MSPTHISPYSGAWYPALADDLGRLLDGCFEESRERTGPHLFRNGLGFVVPHAGPAYCGAVAAAVYRSLNLGADFLLDLRGCGVLRYKWNIRPKIPIRTEQPRHLVSGSRRPPAIARPFAGQRQMQAQIRVRMRLGILGHFRQPGTGHHDAGGTDRMPVESGEAGAVLGVAYRQVVCMDNQQLGVRGVSELPGCILRLSQCQRTQERQPEKPSSCPAWCHVASRRADLIRAHHLTGLAMLDLAP